jgi:hypothetical protein
VLRVLQWIAKRKQRVAGHAEPQALPTNAQVKVLPRRARETQVVAEVVAGAVPPAEYAPLPAAASAARPAFPAFKLDRESAMRSWDSWKG